MEELILRKLVLFCCLSIFLPLGPFLDHGFVEEFIEGNEKGKEDHKKISEEARYLYTQQKNPSTNFLIQT